MISRKDRISSMHVIRINRAVSITPMLSLAFSGLRVGSIRFRRRSAVITGLYNSRVAAAFSPPLIRLKGRKAGSRSSATASLVYPI